MQVSRWCCTRVIWSVGLLGRVIYVTLLSTVSLSHTRIFTSIRLLIHAQSCWFSHHVLGCHDSRYSNRIFVTLALKIKRVCWAVLLIWLDAARIRWGWRKVPYLLQVSQWRFSCTTQRFFFYKGPVIFIIPTTLELHLTPAVSLLYSQKL